MPQIGAPAAWQAGLTGRGVQVAVLDTGIDTDHPDLAGKTTQSRDFSGKGSVEDGNGHGTHVASTITGSGAASGGRYKGVAPDVTLAVGKVLDDNGEGTEDGVIAGMQWAAADVHARIVSMSLGAGPSDGTDPVSAAVNSLSRQYGTLFVVAAGNFGGDETVATPAAADDALAVASVSKQDVLSPFSSRGPRPGDGALKPEIAAPGEDIVAARPAGVEPLGEPVGDAYQRLSGTSMATPHVAGAAAILAQQHPDWAGDRIKAALMNTAHEVAAGPLAVGAGRVDVAHAIGASVIATGSVSAFLPWPNTGARQRKTVTWTNIGSSPVTLQLQAGLSKDGSPAPDGLLTLGATSVTVPAGGSAPVELTVTAQDGKPGTYAGILTARSADGSISTRTAISVRQQEEVHTLTLSMLDRDGHQPAPGPLSAFFIVNLDTGDIFFGGAGTAQLPRGRYGINAMIETPRPKQESSITVISHPELVLDHDVTQVFDARLGQPVVAEPDNPASRGGTHALNVLDKVRTCDCFFGLIASFDPRFQPMYAATIPGAASDAFAFVQSRRATEPTLELTANDGQPFDVIAQSLFGTIPSDQATLPVVFGGSGTAEDLSRIDGHGKLVIIEFDPNLGREEWLRRAVNVKHTGARLALINFVESGASPLPPGDIPGFDELPPTLYGMGNPTVDRLVALAKAGATTATFASRQFPNFRYDLIQGVTRQLTGPQVYRPRTRDLAAVRTAYHDNVPGEVRYAGFMQLFGRFVGDGFTQPAAAQQERTEYFTPGTWDLFWSTAGRGFLDDTVTLTAGRPNRIEWNKAVAGPTFHGLTQTFLGEEPRPWAWRKNGALNLVLPVYGDAAGRPRTADPFDGEVAGSVNVYRDGTLAGTAPIFDITNVAVPDQASTYRITAEARRSDANWQLSTVVSTDWTFRSSAAGDGKALPLLTARFAPGVDVRNRAPGGCEFTFPAYVERPDASPRVTSFTVEVSYDDGAHWQPATVRRDHDHWTVAVRHPRSGYASLRARIVDADGNQAVQTVVRAYQIG